jgi:hypothetical protein
MSFNNIPPSSLSRFSIGEITQLVGPPSLYDAGSSKWLVPNVYVSSASLSATTKTYLSSGSNIYGYSASLLTAYENSLAPAYPHMPLPAQRISSASVTVSPCCSGTTTPIVTAVTSTGAQNINLPITSFFASGSTGTNIAVASNNTTIFAYTITSDANFGAVSTTDGVNWSSVTLTGLPSFTGLTPVRAWGSGTLTNNTVYGRYKGATTRYSVFWCGARFILVTANDTSSTNVYITSTSTDGIAWSGDTTSTVLGGSISNNNSLDFYRNGNNCFLNIASTWRKSTDGGITWSNCASTPMANTGQNYQKLNANTPAKFFYHNGSTNSYFSADSGATWTNRTLPTNANWSVAYKGSTVLIGNTSLVYRSVNDGATWTTVTFPSGTLSNGAVVFADANRFYACIYAQPQILVSSDGITWTIVSVPANSFAFNSGIGGIISFDSNNVVLLGYCSPTGTEILALTNDGGVTWKNLTVNNISGNSYYAFASDAFITPDGLGGGTTAFGGSNGGAYYGGTYGNITNNADVIAGGSFYRIVNGTVTPTNANATIYARIE